MIELLCGARFEGETDNAVIACNDYLRLGAGRSLRDLAEKYSKVKKNTAPTQSLNTLMSWSAKFDWQARTSEYDATWEDRKNAERDAVLNRELALDYERVKKLVRLADFLEDQIFEQAADGTFPNVWIEDVKGIGSKEDFERVELVRFNAPLLAEYRAALDDIAKEVGGRIKKTDVTTGGEKLTFNVSYGTWREDG